LRDGRRASALGEGAEFHAAHLLHGYRLEASDESRSHDPNPSHLSFVISHLSLSFILGIAVGIPGNTPILLAAAQ
jgi:hypothetical protein